MKIKTIASISLLASASSAYALIAPNPGAEAPEPTTYCLDIFEDNKNNVYLGTCDQSFNNQRSGIPLQENGCASQQAAFVSVNVEIAACPSFVQL